MTAQTAVQAAEAALNPAPRPPIASPYRHVPHTYGVRLFVGEILGRAHHDMLNLYASDAEARMGKLTEAEAALLLRLSTELGDLLAAAFGDFETALAEGLPAALERWRDQLD